MARPSPASRRGPGLSPDEEAWVLERAQVPEHVPRLLALLSGGRPGLVEEHLVIVGADLAILVGYPLAGEATPARLDRLVATVRARWRPSTLRYVGPFLPPSLAEGSEDLGSDHYYGVDVGAWRPPPRLAAVVEKAARRFRVERAPGMDREHGRLLRQFVAASEMTPDVRSLYARIEHVLAQDAACEVLGARDEAGVLQALYVIERSARHFDAYVLGARKLEGDSGHASDLLMAETIRRCRAAGKPRLDLGLGVNDGVRRFKRKWGGEAGLPYVSCEWCAPRPGFLRMLQDLWRGPS